MSYSIAIDGPAGAGKSTIAKLIAKKKGYIYVDDSRETNVPGLYAVGDCVHKTTRQVITAVADGVVAAVAITRKL